MATVLITGAAGGLGRALHRAFAAAGHTVIATDIAGADHVLDVTDAAACREAAHRHRPDVWINNAALLGAGSAADQPDDTVARVVAVNLLGCIHGTRAALAVMRQRGSGHIITIGSLGSWVPVPGESLYGATKAAILSYSLGLLAEIRDQGFSDVHISVVCPDGMLTPMLVEAIDDPNLALSFSGPKLADPDDVAARVVRLVQRPRRVLSVPRWRGAMVRALAGMPDHALGLSQLFARQGSRRQARARAGLQRPGA